MKETVGTGSQTARLLDGLTDDYEIWNGELPETLRKDKSVMYVSCLRDCKVERRYLLPRAYHTEASTGAESREAVVLISGAWKTWVADGLFHDTWLMCL